MEKNENKAAVRYVPGIFDAFKQEDNYECWDRFPDTMWGLGYEMDACESFNAYVKHVHPEVKYWDTSREMRRRILFLLEQADRQIVGNFLFSLWRYYTHWEVAGDEYLPDFFHRIIAILESKY